MNKKTIRLEKELRRLKDIRSQYWTCPEPTTDASWDAFNSEFAQLNDEIEEVERLIKSKKKKQIKTLKGVFGILNKWTSEELKCFNKAVKRR